jgi:hypothetical protein
MGSENNPRTVAAMAPRPRLSARPLHEIYKLPPHALVTPPEAGLLMGLTVSALAVRRSKGQWPPYVKFGRRLVLYVLGQLIAPPEEVEPERTHPSA